ncbi:hypothetical protein [Nitrosomonas sp.]|uniref:hypothetical protein n=1 Tax=Nitrosomonas sp. TaxID=42353 RepID=UPI0025DAE005|nr:hypothetical protein [Nitrosomonas sp.]
MPITLIALLTELQQISFITRYIAMMLASVLVILRSFLIGFYSLPKAIVSNQYTIKFMQTEPGLHIDLFQCGKKTLTFVISSHYVMILVNRHVPVMDCSRNTVRFHEQIIHGARLFSIAVTAGTTNNDFIECLATEKNDFLPIPHIVRNSAPLVR